MKTIITLEPGVLFLSYLCRVGVYVQYLVVALIVLLYNSTFLGHTHTFFMLLLCILGIIFVIMTGLMHIKFKLVLI